jgi:hypothetical protein
LPSWNDGATKKSITDFVVTTAGGPDFAPSDQRMANFDNKWTVVDVKKDWKRVFAFQ